MSSDEDRRFAGHDEYLTGAELRCQPFRAERHWEHGHCDFCWTKFMDPQHSAGHRRFIDANPDVLTHGYATTEAHPEGAGRYWVCPTCARDFRGRLGLTLLGDAGDP